MAQKSLTNNLSAEEMIVIAQIRLEILRYALTMTGSQGLAKVMEAAKTMDQFCFVDCQGAYLEIETKGNA